MSESYSYYKGEPYHNHSYVQAELMSTANRFFLDATRYIKFEGAIFTICDYGCSDGNNSFKVMGSLIGYLRKTHGSKFAIQLVYEDLPDNDFNSLFRAVRDNGLYDDVFLSAVPISFYKQTVPDGCVNLAVSTSSFHWLPSSPCPLRNSLMGQLSDIEEERVEWQTAAAESWKTLLLSRASEMAEGAAACFMMPGHQDEESVCGLFTMAEAMSEIYQGMVSDDLLTKEEYERTTLNMYLRSEKEFLLPLMENTPVHNAGLRLATFTWIAPPERQHEVVKEINHNSELADKMVLAHRVFTNHAFYSALSDSRSEQEKEMTVDLLYHRYRQLIQHDPQKYCLDSQVMSLELLKV